jgi:hypothetical protein
MDVRTIDSEFDLWWTRKQNESASPFYRNLYVRNIAQTAYRAGRRADDLEDEKKKEEPKKKA